MHAIQSCRVEIQQKHNIIITIVQINIINAVIVIIMVIFIIIVIATAVNGSSINVCCVCAVRTWKGVQPYTGCTSPLLNRSCRCDGVWKVTTRHRP
jgi:hypothetical protein